MVARSHIQQYLRLINEAFGRDMNKAALHQLQTCTENKKKMCTSADFDCVADKVPSRRPQSGDRSKTSTPVDDMCDSFDIH